MSSKYIRASKGGFAMKQKDENRLIFIYCIVSVVKCPSFQNTFGF
jgi:hypothetical protein